MIDVAERTAESHLAAAALARDIGNVRGDVEAATSRLSALAERATAALQLALDRAPGMPHDRAWHDAHASLTRLVQECHGTAAVAALERLRAFLAENADLET